MHIHEFTVYIVYIILLVAAIIHVYVKGTPRNDKISNLGLALFLAAAIAICLNLMSMQLHAQAVIK